jgi:hypothetical protein
MLKFDVTFDKFFITSLQQNTEKLYLEHSFNWLVCGLFNDPTSTYIVLNEMKMIK